MQRVLRWRSDGGLEHAVLSDGPDGLRVDSVVIGTDDHADAGEFALAYSLACDSTWHTRAVDVRVVGGASLSLRSDGNGRWRDAGGNELPALGGCTDVDLSATPLTNTLPVRRLAGRLRLRRGVLIRVAYIEAPRLTLTVSGQRYTELAQGRYRFELTDGSFEREITVDGEGYVLDYPGPFTRA